jgi:hypothetical protein
MEMMVVSIAPLGALVHLLCSSVVMLMLVRYRWVVVELVRVVMGMGSITEIVVMTLLCMVL